MLPKPQRRKGSAVITVYERSCCQSYRSAFLNGQSVCQYEHVQDAIDDILDDHQDDGMCLNFFGVFDEGTVVDYRCDYSHQGALVCELYPWRLIREVAKKHSEPEGLSELAVPKKPT